MKTSIARFQGTDQLEQAIAQVVAATSDGGYLSIYESIDATDPEKWRTDAKVRMRKLSEDTQGADGTALADAIDRAMASLNEWADSGTRSCVGFLELSDQPRDIWIDLDVPVSPLVAVGRDPSIGQLLSLSGSTVATGVVCWSNDIVVIDEWKGTDLERMSQHRSEEVDTEDVSLGQGATAPGGYNQSMLQRDRFEMTAKEHRHKWLLEWSRDELRKLISARGWQRIIQFGPGQIEESEIAQPGSMLECIDGGRDVLIHEPMAKLRSRVQSILSEQEHDRSSSLVRDAVGGRPGTVVGMEECEKALDTGRVALLLLGSNGGEELPAQEPLVRRALETSSELLFVRGDDALPLFAVGGVAAILRY